jgi:general secretion pathway protein C
MTPARLAIWAVNAALFVLCCYLTAGLVNAGIAGWLSGRMQAAATPTPTASAPPGRDWTDRQAILERNLFQVSTLLPEEPVAPEVTEEELEATRLPIKLLGTVAANDPKLSWAAIEDEQSRKQDVVKVDDKLLEKATVVRIERRRIVIQNGGKREELALDEEESGAPKARPVAARVPTATPASPDDLRDRIRRLSEGNFQVAREQVEETMRNPAELFSEARILPKYDNGQMVGVQLSSIKPGSLFEEIGIQNGDTVTQVNGITVSSPQDSAALLRELTESTEFQVNVMGADGQTRTLTYSIGE